MDQDIPSIKSEVQDDFKPSIEMKAMANFESTVKVEKIDQDDFDEGMKLWNESLKRGIEIINNDGFKPNPEIQFDNDGRDEAMRCEIEVTEDVDIKHQIKAELDKDEMAEGIRHEIEVTENVEIEPKLEKAAMAAGPSSDSSPCIMLMGKPSWSLGSGMKYVQASFIFNSVFHTIEVRTYAYLLQILLAENI